MNEPSPSAAALELLRQRASTPPRLMTRDGPSQAEIDRIIEAGLAAPDHGQLHPMRFLLIEGPARERLGELFVEAVRRQNPQAPEEALETIRAKPLRAPVLIATIARLQHDHPKIPAVEQHLSAGAAMSYMLLAAQWLGYGAIWLTGPMAYDDHVRAGLGLSLEGPLEERLVGFLYVGGAAGKLPGKPRPAVADHLARWDG